MANSQKLKKGLQTKGKNNAIIGIIVAVVIISIVGYLVYISGFISRVMTGMKVTNVNESGNTVVLDNISVAEMDIHYFQVLNTYYSRGIVDNETDLDSVMDETTGKTIRQSVMDQAADEIKNIYFVLEWAKVNIPNYSDLEKVASHYMDVSIENLRDTAKTYNYPNLSSYLQTMYGSGVSLRTYREVVQKEIVAELVQTSVNQFEFGASKEDLQATYDKNPLVYQRADFNYYFFAADSSVDDEGNVVFDNTNALKLAHEVADASTDSLSFNLAVMDRIEDKDTLAQFEQEQDPTLVEGGTTSMTDGLAGGIMTDFIFTSGEIGSTEVFEVESGAWVVLLNNRYEDAENTVIYRTLVLYNDKRAVDGCSEAEIAAGADALEKKANEIVASVTDERSFAAAVGMNSSNVNDVVDGGLSDGMVLADFESQNGAEIPQATLDLKNWAFDANRKPGDMVVIRGGGDATVTIYYFVDNMPAWMYVANQQVITTQSNMWGQDTSIIPENAGVQIAYDLVKRLTY